MLNNTVFGYSTFPIGPEQVAINGGQAHLRFKSSLSASLVHVCVDEAHKNSVSVEKMTGINITLRAQVHNTLRWMYKNKCMHA